MGFFDSFNGAFNDESQKSAERIKYSSYQTVKQKKNDHFNDHFNDFNSQSDSVLLGKINGIFTSDEDKEMIDGILRSRGYRKATNGTYHRL